MSYLIETIKFLLNLFRFIKNGGTIKEIKEELDNRHKTSCIALLYKLDIKAAKNPYIYGW